MAGRRVVLAALLEQMREQMPEPLRSVTDGAVGADLVYFPFDSQPGVAGAADADHRARPGTNAVPTRLAGQRPTRGLS
jgi:hypothetical protein